MKKVSFFRLSIRKLRRTITRSPLQFIAIALITALSSTLFLGLTASYKTFEDRIQNVYKLSNVGDIWTTVEVTSDSPSEDIQGIVGDKGKVESRRYTSTSLNGYSAYLGLQDKLPTINTPFQTSNKEETNYFILDYRYIDSKFSYGDGTTDTWLNPDGSFKAVKVQIPLSSLHSKLKENAKAFTYLKTHAEELGKTNILDNDFVNFSITPTGTMKNVENVVQTEDLPAVNYLSRSLFNSVMVNTFKDTYGDIKEVPTDPDELFAYNIITNPSKYITEEYFKDNQYITKLNDSSKREEVKNDISKYFENKSSNNLLLNVDLDNMQTTSILNSDLKQSKTLAFTVPIVFFLVAILVVLTTFTQIIFKDRNEIGTQKALGVSNKRIIGYYIALTSIVVLVGVILGTIIGPLLLPGLMSLKYNSLYFLTPGRYVFPTVPFIGMTAIILLLCSALTYFIVRKESKLLPAESMRPKAPKSVKNKNKGVNSISLYNYLKTIDKINKKQLKIDIKNNLVKVNDNVVNDPKYKVDLFNDQVKYKEEVIKYKYQSRKISFKLAIRNIRCSIPRSIMVIVGVAGCTGLLAAGFGIDDSLNNSVAQDMNTFYGKTDLLAHISTSEPITKIKELKKQSKISDYDGYCQLPVETFKTFYTNETYSTYIYGINPYSSFIDNALISKPGTVTVSQKVAKNLNIKIGTKLGLRVFGKTYYREVGKIVDNFYAHGVFVSLLEYSDLQSYVSNIFIKVNTNTSSKDEIKNALKGTEGLSNIKSIDDVSKNLYKIMSTFKSITLVIKVFAILLAVVVIYNLALLNYRERSRDLATMKVLGFSKLDISLSLVIEILLLTLVGIVIGLCIGYPLEVFLLTINATSIVEFLYAMRFISLFLSFVITFVTVFLVNIYLGYRIKKIKMVESLKSIE